MPETNGASQKDISQSNSTEISESFIDQIRDAQTPAERQKISDGIFTEQRRNEMLARASKDRHGRPVRYYRGFRLEKLYDLLEKGEQKATDYFDNPDAKITETAQLVYRLADYAVMQNFITDDEGFDVWGKLSLEECLSKLKEFNPDFASLSSTPTYRDVLGIMEKLPLRFVGRVHTGSSDQIFSPFLSFSVGGPIDDKLYSKNVIIECVLPDSQIYLQEDSNDQEAEYGIEAINGEKEVFAKSIPVDAITRVYFSPDEYRRDFIESDDAPSAPYRELNKYSPIEAWRWNTLIFDYLPAQVTEKALAEFEERKKSEVTV